MKIDFKIMYASGINRTILRGNRFNCTTVVLTVLIMVLTVILLRKSYCVKQLGFSTGFSSRIVNLENKLDKISTLYDTLLVENRQLKFRQYVNRSNNSVDPKLNEFLLNSAECAVDSYKVLIMIWSQALNFGNRQRIRNTWGVHRNLNKPLWRTIFHVSVQPGSHVAKRILEESQKYGDILFGVSSNTTHTIRTGFEWSVSNCKFEFLLKGDDNIFVNVPRLLNFLAHPDTPKTELYAGNVHFKARVHRDGEFAVSQREFKKSVYPRYCYGGGFVLSRDALEGIISKLDVVKPFNVEDVYIGALALKAGIDVTPQKDFLKSMAGSKCEFSKVSVVQQPVTTAACIEKLYKLSMTDQNVVIVDDDTKSNARRS